MLKIAREMSDYGHGQVDEVRLDVLVGGMSRRETGGKFVPIDRSIRLSSLPL
jgi:hypothetical protein